MSTSLYSQQNLSAWQCNYMGGKIFKHSPKIHIAVPPYSQALELSYTMQTLGKKEWHQRYGFPEIGMSVTAANYGSSALGYAIGVYPTIQTRLIKIRSGNLYLKVGAGLGYVSKKWNRLPNEDTLNNIIGSHINNFTMFQLGVKQPINKHWVAHAGFHFFHTSNASAKQPNLGINAYGLFIGASYYPNTYVNVFEKKVWGASKNPLEFYWKNSIAYAEDKVVDGPMYSFFSNAMMLSKKYRNKSKIQVGLEATYSSKLYALFVNNHIYPGQERKKAWIYSAFLSHEFIFGSVGVPLQMGTYIRRELGGIPVYQKLGFNVYMLKKPYGFLKNIYASALLKTHFLQAEYAEFGLGFVL
ncbi:MAG: acyloxyacyl hydrolase [Chitinophagaceae bacterium]